MVCSPHQYIVQRLAVGYQMKPQYQQEVRSQPKVNYEPLAKPEAYQSQVNRLPGIRIYRTNRQNEAKYNPKSNYQLLPLAQPLPGPEQTFPNREETTSPWRDYGLPLYIAEEKARMEPSLTIMEPPLTIQQPSKKRELLHRLIRQELDHLQRQKHGEEKLCAA